MKGKDWFSTLKTQGKISHEEYDKFIETVPEFEIPDGAVKAFEQKFMTIERASVNDEVVGAIRKKTLNPLDRDLKAIVEFIEGVDKYSAMEISRLTRNNEGHPDTYKQFEAIKEKLPAIIEKVRVAPNDEEAKKEVAKYKKALEEKAEQFAKLNKEKEESVKHIDEEWGKKFKNHKIDSMLEKMSNSYTFGEAYEKNRELLTKAILGDLKSGNLFDITTKDGAEVLGVFEQKDGAMIPKFNGNDPVTVQGLLDEKLKPFLKVNGTESSEGATTVKQFRVDNQNQNPQTRTGARVTAEI